MTNHKDEYYIQEVIKGNVNAFTHIVERYKDMVFTLALKILRDREEAEEVAQDVFVKSYQSLPGFRGKSKFSSWLYRITYNACMDVIKRKKKYNVPQDISVINDATVEQEQDMLGLLMLKDRNKAIKDAIGKLPEDDQVILLLYYFEELSLKEVAKIVNLSASNVKVKLHRSRKRLCKLLEHNALIRG